MQNSVLGGTKEHSFGQAVDLGTVGVDCQGCDTPVNCGRLLDLQLAKVVVQAKPDTACVLQTRKVQRF